MDKARAGAALGEGGGEISARYQSLSRLRGICNGDQADIGLIVIKSSPQIRPSHSRMWCTLAVELSTHSPRCTTLTQQ
ncbi:hypothetical protein J6590_007080 [Homalodisca vitripennis]|nr:hypothetical protein J6590_007080 [Homalodisca vitripennis]